MNELFGGEPPRLCEGVHRFTPARGSRPGNVAVRVASKYRVPRRANCVSNVLVPSAGPPHAGSKIALASGTKGWPGCGSSARFASTALITPSPSASIGAPMSR